MECELYFAGLIVLQNKLKIVTKPTILTLKHAGIRTVMITGTTDVVQLILCTHTAYSSPPASSLVVDGFP